MNVQNTKIQNMATPNPTRRLFGSSVKSANNTGDHDWENIKENAKPLKRGRDVKKLNSFARGALSTRKAETHRNEQKRDFENQITIAATDSSADSLEPWNRYIKWTEEEYPAGGQQSNVLILLERCCRTFLKDEEMKNEERYIKIWLKYFDLLEEPLPLFRFLCANRIGERVSLFTLRGHSLLSMQKIMVLLTKCSREARTLTPNQKKCWRIVKNNSNVAWRATG